MPGLKYESYVFDPRPRYPFLITAKRYWSAEYYSDDPEAVTLICTHGTGFHKEHWEPTLEHLYDKLANSNPTIKVRDAWSIDAPNHGDAAVLNEEVLQWGYTSVFGWEEYARSVHAFLTGLGKGVDVDFQSRKLVGIGHSMGAITLMLTDTYMPQIAFKSLILVDPMLLRKPRPDEPQLDLVSGAAKRRDIWLSREEALHSLQSRASFKIWDPRVLRIFVDYGLRPLPTADYPDRIDGVTLKCPRAQEAACYRDAVGRVRAYRYLPTLCARIPVHFIYGAIDDYLPRDIKDDVLYVAAGSKYATLSRVFGAGHLIPQVQPKGLADAIFSALIHDASSDLKSRTVSQDIQSKL